MLRPGLPIAAVALALLGTAPAAHAIQDQPAPAEAPATPAAVFSGKDLIVQWTPGADRGDKVDAREAAEVDFTTNLGDRDFQLVTVEPGQSAHDAIASLEADPAVAVAERDSYSAPAAVPNDPLLGELWGLDNLGGGVDGFSGAVAGDDVSAIAAWDRTIGVPSVVVADVDSGYRFEHPDLAGVAWNNPEEIENGKDDDNNGIVDDMHGADFVGDDGEKPEQDGNPTDSDLLSGGHGVHTAGTIGAQGNNGVGISGVARNIRLMPLRVCSRFPALEDSRCPISSQIAAINYAADKGARVVNMSLTSTFFSQAEANVIAEHPALLFVIAAGNDGGDNDGGGAAPQGHHYPCDYQPQLDASPPILGAVDNVVCVAATDQADELAGFSDWGATSVDLGAPGTEILSTYPFPTPLDERFGDEAAFATEWPATGADGGFERSNEAPLTSFGMTDRVGEPSAKQVRETTSAPVTVPPNSGCQLNQTRHVSLAGGDSYRYSLLLDGVEKVSSQPTSSAVPGLERRFLELPAAFEAGGSVQVRFRFTTGSAPTPESGVWLDDVSLTCTQAVGLASGYGFLQGTSMAAPQVSGAAALLFSLKPTATVTEAREALLLGVDPVLSLEGKTTSGGRLDVAAALEALVPIGSETVAPQTAITAGPSGTTASEEAEFEFTRTDADAGSFECKLDTGTFEACTSPVSYPVEDGKHAFAVRSKIEPVGLVDPSPAERSWTVSASPPEEDEPDPEPEPKPPAEEKPPVTPPATPPSTPNVVQMPPAETPPVVIPPPPGCAVPKLAGLSLKGARAALAADGCTLGTVRKPRARPGHRLPALVVKSSSPAAGARSASGKVKLVLVAKPNATKSHR
ncbi:MAG: S8 family serine peptidase [Solirubrobacterales bacterium]